MRATQAASCSVIITRRRRTRTTTTRTTTTTTTTFVALADPFLGLKIIPAVISHSALLYAIHHVLLSLFPAISALDPYRGANSFRWRSLMSNKTAGTGADSRGHVSFLGPTRSSHDLGACGRSLWVVAAIAKRRMIDQNWALARHRTPPDLSHTRTDVRLIETDNSASQNNQSSYD